MLQASVTSLTRDKCSLSWTSEFFLPTVSGLKYTHPSVCLTLSLSLPASLFLLEKTGWAKPRPCNLRPDFHWKQMLSIRCKDRLMFSKAYNNKPRGLSHASWGNRSERPEYQLRSWLSERVGERVSERVSEWASEWVQRESGRGGRHAREEVRNREKHGERENSRGDGGGTQWVIKVWMLRKNRVCCLAHSLCLAVLYITVCVFLSLTFIQQGTLSE